MNEKRYWLDQPGNVKKVVWTLWGICGVLLVADLVYQKHAVYDWEALPFFFPVFGFLAGTVIVLGAKELRKVIKRDEDYYDR